MLCHRAYENIFLIALFTATWQRYISEALYSFTAQAYDKIKRENALRTNGRGRTDRPSYRDAIYKCRVLESYRLLTNTLTHNATLPLGQKSSICRTYVKCPKLFLGFGWIRNGWDECINRMAGRQIRS